MRTLNLTALTPYFNVAPIFHRREKTGGDNPLLLVPQKESATTSENPSAPILGIWPYHKPSAVKAILLMTPMKIVSCWGDTATIRAGGVAVLRLNDGAFYGEQGVFFNKMYERVSPMGQIIAPLDLPLEEQRALVEKAGDMGHLLDVQKRIALRDFPNRPEFFQKTYPRTAPHLVGPHPGQIAA